ncbi:MAG: hypothetical protein AAF687_06745 [Pseudomonadota bacterium]
MGDRRLALYQCGPKFMERSDMDEPVYGVVKEGVLTSGSMTEDDIVTDYLKIFALMMEERRAGQTISEKVLLQINATNGYVKIGWRAVSEVDPDDPDGEWDLAPYFINFPDLFESGDADAFEQPARFAANDLSTLFYEHSYESEACKTKADTAITDHFGEPITDFPAPSGVFFRVFYMNELDYVIHDACV